MHMFICLCIGMCVGVQVPVKAGGGELPKVSAGNLIHIL